MLVARTPPSPSGNPYFASRDYASQPAAAAPPPASSSSNAQAPHLAPRPGVARRPSALRKASSDHIITPAVTRFVPRPAYIPPTSPARASASGSAVHQEAERASSPGASASAASSSTLPPPVDAALARSPSSSSSSGSPPVRPSLNPLGATSSSGGSGSLLARRRSSRTAARADVLPMLSDLSLKGALPTAGLALDELDDTVRPAVIGESSHAQTPASEAASPVLARNGAGRAKEVVEGEFKPTRSFVPTPFPEKRPHWLSDEEDELDSPVQPFSPAGQREHVVGSRDDAGPFEEKADA
ncbi:hypothetical protein JCM10450v2_005305 [Rhodotorula kratochvilovae]